LGKDGMGSPWGRGRKSRWELGPRRIGV
jgi:hypothetical protein